MNCPFCGNSQIMVINSRPTLSDAQIWRRRKCLNCGERFTSYEKINLSHLIVVKKSGRHQKFNRAKLFAAIYHSFLDRKNVDRGEAAGLAEEITNRAEGEIIKLKRKRIKSTEIEEIVSAILGKRIPDAFLRFLAYRRGEDSKRLKIFVKKYF